MFQHSIQTSSKIQRLLYQALLSNFDWASDYPSEQLLKPNSSIESDYWHFSIGFATIMYLVLISRPVLCPTFFTPQAT